jgi:tetratricopeptide (TPR) repeat protein
LTEEVDRQRESFDRDPNDTRAFDGLEEHYFLGGHWDELVDLYRRRAQAPSVQQHPATHARLLFRLGQVLEERCLDPDAALEVYWQVARLDPQFRPALHQARQVHASRGQWDLVLQIAEIEGQLPMRPYERAVFLAEMGAIWLSHLSDPGQALGCFEEALAADPQNQVALSGRARSLEKLGRVDEAIQVWEQLIDVLRGPDRAPALVSLARLVAGPMKRPERAAELYRRALTDDPRNQDAVEALAMLAASREQWPLLADLYERRFDLAAGARRRTNIALEAGHLHLERLNQTQTARLWFGRALDLCPDEPAVHQAIAELERRAGNGDALLAALERVIDLSRATVPASTLLEAADLRSERGDEETALAHLKLAHERAPANPLVLGALSETLTRLGRTAELAEILEQRASLGGETPAVRVESLRELARIQEEELADPDAARDCLARAFEIDAAAPGVAGALERLCRKAEAWDQIRDVLERARREGPEAERPGYAASLGEVLAERLGDERAAAQAFEAALELDPGCERALRGLARIAAATGDEDSLLRAYEREAAVATDRARLRFLVGELDRLFEARGRSADALPWLERLAQLEPENRAALERAGRLLEQLGQCDRAIPLLERLDALLAGSEQAANRRLLAELHERTGREADAVAWYEKALDSEPGDRTSLEALHRRYRAARRTEDAVRVQRRLAELLPDEERAGCLDELARILEEELGDLDGAVVVLWRLAELEGRPADTEERLEHLLERAGRTEELAQLLAEKRRALSDDDPAALALDLRRARLLLDPLGQYEDAATAFRAVLARSPASREALEGLEASLRAGTDPVALADFLAERAREESDPALRARRELECAVLLEERGGEFDRARSAYAALADESPEPGIAAEAAARLETLLEREGDWPALRARLERALEQATPEQELALRERLASLCRDRLGDRDGCIAHLEAAARIAPTRGTIWRSLGILYQENDRPRDLARALEGELAAEPDAERELSLRVQAARLAADSGDLARAATHFERALALDPSHPEASEFLVAHYEREGRPAEVARLLERRLAELAPDPEARSQVVALRLRIAALHADALADVETAIAILEPARDAVGASPVVAEPLADLYQRAGRGQALADLCRRAAQACHEPEERAAWWVRLGDCLRTQEGDASLSDAAKAYRAALAERPDDPETRAALRELHRRLDQPAPLVELLRVELARADLDPEVELPLRRELSELLAGPLEQPAEALHALERVLALDPDDAPARERALALAERLNLHQEHLALLDAALEGPAASHGAPTSPSSPRRTEWLERKGDLLAGPLDCPEDACSAYRAALAIQPDRRGARRKLGAVLEKLGRWPAVLDCLYLESRATSGAERAAILERGVAIASAHLSADAGLPWLERLRAERPDDAAVIARIADVHRQAGRPEALLRALEDELVLDPSRERRCQLHLERARVLERDLRSPGRALLALGAAREAGGDQSDVLRELDRLTALLGRPRERAELVETRIRLAGPDPSASMALHRTAAELYDGALAEPERALPHWLRAIAAAPQGSQDRLELLRALQGSLRSVGALEAWVRAAEAELEELGASQPARRLELRRELASRCAGSLGRPEAAVRHLRALLDGDGALSTQLDGDARAEIEESLLELLRARGEILELASRLEGRLARGAGDADEWLELARLRDERLHAPAGARAAYREALVRRPSQLAAIRGLRSVSERLRDWPGLAHAIELELAQGGSSRARATLLRKLGDVCWRRLEAPERACDALRAALEVEPGDLEALRSLARLCAIRGEWSEELALGEREIGILGASEPARRKSLWLRIGALARDRAGDPRKALAAYERAAEIEALEPAALREWAELYRSTGDVERYAEVFGDWCDCAEADARPEDHLALVEVLEGLGRGEQALARAEAAQAADPSCAAAWDAAARLHQARGEDERASRALARAAECCTQGGAADRFVRAARLVETRDLPRTAALLRRAVEADPASSPAAARLACTAARLERWEEAELHAARALDAADDLDAALRFETAFAGGRAARERGRLEAAAGFFAAATALDPDRADALEAEGETLFALGDLAGARRALKRRLALPGDNPRRAQQLCMSAAALESEERPEEALALFREALEADPREADAHAGATRILEELERTDEAVRALEQWARAARDGQERSALLLRAAELESGRGRMQAAEEHLRQSVQSDAGNARAWRLLVEWLWEAGRANELLDASERALEHLEDAPERAPVALLRARALEADGEPAEAAEAYGEAVAGDPRCNEAALARARLLRAAGSWEEAARLLADFAERHPEPASAALAAVHCERGRLMAGPLEDVEEAVRCYQRAVELQPELIEAREPLARLLTHVPERWREAVEHHRALVAASPLHAASLRDLVRIARDRGCERAEVAALAVLRALGIASPEERERAPASVPLPMARGLRLGPEAWEQLRRAAREVARELAEVLPPAPELASPEEEPGALSAFRRALVHAEGELCAPALVALPVERLRETLTALAALALEPGGAQGGGADTAALERAVGRWTRRKLRRALEGARQPEIEAIDFEAWRGELRILAALAVLDEGGGDLRSALLTLAADAGAEVDAELPDAADISPLAACSDAARGLLGRVAEAICAELLASG